jgi:hypothetical protein
MRGGRREVKTQSGWKVLKSMVMTKASLATAATAQPKAGLATTKKEVHRGGQTFTQTFHMRPDDFKGGQLYGLTDHDYAWATKVAKVMRTGIPNRQAFKRSSMLALKKKLDDGVKKGWKLSGGGDIHKWSEALGKLAGAMTKSVRLVLPTLAKATEFKKLKKYRTFLSDEERAQCVHAGAVWSDGADGVWKSKHPTTGKVTYVSNTHCAYHASPMLRGAIKHFPAIKETS